MAFFLLAVCRDALDDDDLVTLRLRPFFNDDAAVDVDDGCDCGGALAAAVPAFGMDATTADDDSDGSGGTGTGGAAAAAAGWDGARDRGVDDNDAMIDDEDDADRDDGGTSSSLSSLSSSLLSSLSS